VTDQPDLPEEWTTAALLRKVDEGWQELNDRLAKFPEDSLDESVGGGWTRRQMLRHLTVWHELTAKRLAEYQHTRQRPGMPKTVDEINDDAISSAEGRTRDQLLAELDSSFHALRDEIGKLRDEQLTELDTWPGGVVVGNTYGHYEEHYPDLEPA
jgi:hypothetical protein